MFSISRLVGVALVCLPVAIAIQAQDMRHVFEPKMPPVCAVIPAPLTSTPAGPQVGSTVAQQDFVSASATSDIQTAINNCAANMRSSSPWDLTFSTKLFSSTR